MAVTSGDNSNILIARVARETFGVQRVVARIYDPTRAAIYERLGIATVASVAWTAARALRHVIPEPTATEWLDPTSSFALVERRAPASIAGTSVSELDERGSARGVARTHRHCSAAAAPTLLIQQDDVLHLMVATEALATVDQLLSHADRSHEGGHA